MNSRLKVLCPNCAQVVVPEVSLEGFEDPVDFRGDGPILIDHPDIRITIKCKTCGETNIFYVTAGPLFFHWVGP